MLFTAWSRNLDDAQIVVQRLDTRERRIIIRGGTSARYVPTGHIVYARAGALMAVPFDVSRLEVTGDPISVAEGVSLAQRRIAQFDISLKRARLFMSRAAFRGLGGGWSGWIARAHKNSWQHLPGTIRPRASRRMDSKWLSRSRANDDIWVYDIPRETLTRLTFQARSLKVRSGHRTASESSFDRYGLEFSICSGSSRNGGGEEERLAVSQCGQIPWRCLQTAKHWSLGDCTILRRGPLDTSTHGGQETAPFPPDAV